MFEVTTIGSHTGNHFFVKFAITLLMCSCGSSFQMVCKAFFNSSIVMGFG